MRVSEIHVPQGVMGSCLFRWFWSKGLSVNVLGGEGISSVRLFGHMNGTTAKVLKMHAG